MGSMTRGRGRPPKYGRPSQIVALTLPRTVVQALERLHRDLGWAIVSLVENTRLAPPARSTADAQLVQIGHGQSIIVESTNLRSIPGATGAAVDGRSGAPSKSGAPRSRAGGDRASGAPRAAQPRAAPCAARPKSAGGGRIRACVSTRGQSSSSAAAGQRPRTACRARRRSA